MPDDKSTSSGVNENRPLGIDAIKDVLEDSDKSVQIHKVGDKYSVIYKGKEGGSPLTLQESVEMWRYMTNWILNLSDELGKNSDLNVSKQVLNVMVQKVMHECDVARAKEAKEKSPIIIP